MGEGNQTLEEMNKGMKSDKSHRESSASGSGSESEAGNEKKSPTTTETELGEGTTEEGEGKKKLDVDATINEASDLAEQTEHQQAKEQAAQRKGESLDGEDGVGGGGGKGDGRGLGSRERMEREREGRERGKRIVGKNQERFE